MTLPGQNQLMTKETNAMKPIPEAALRNGDDSANGEVGKTPAAAPAEPTAPVGAPKHFRRLKPGEVVNRGDFVANEHRGLEPWEGPGGFRAGAFVKPIYRETKTVRPQPKKPK